MKNEEIFDYIVEMEDNLLNNVRVELRKDAYQKFGEDGLKIVDKYYRQIDGDEDFDVDEIDDCNECKEKGKKLVEILECLRQFNDILSSDTYSNIIKDLDKNLKSKFFDFNGLIKSIKESSCVEIDSETERKILIRFLLEKCKELIKNGSGFNKDVG